MRPPRVAPVLAALLHLGLLAKAELRDVPSPEDFVRKFSATAIVVGDYVYIDGGAIVQLENGAIRESRKTNQVNSTLSIDLSKSWITTEVKFREIPKAPGPVKANVALWADPIRNSFYSWGGKWEYGANMTEMTLWKFSADGSGGGRWSAETPSNPSTFNGLVPAEFMAFASTNNTGYAIGGIASGWTELHRGHSQVIPGMLSYNFDTKEWTNGTISEGFSPFHTLAMASAHYVPTFGPNGLIMVLGGHRLEVDEEPSVGNSPAFNFENMTFFDPVAKKTYSQKATGSIPASPRSEFCATGFQNTDGGYEIFIFGGEDKFSQKKYQDAYVLSLPGFVWTKLPTPPAGGRAYHSCVTVGNRQVLSIGGFDEIREEKDKAPQGLLVFDMTNMKWNDFYDASLPAYEAPGAIKQWYQQNSVEEIQWSSEEVKKLFVKQTDGSPGGSSDQNPTDQAASASTPVAAIAGGVAGGVIGLAAIALVAWLLYRRRKRSGAPGGVSEADHGSPRNELPVGSSAAEVGNGVGYSELHGFGGSSPKPPEKPLDINGYAELPQSGPGMEVVQEQGPRAFAAELDGGHGPRYS